MIESFLHQVSAKWRVCAEQGLMKYGIDEIKTKVLKNNGLSFVLQYNEGRITQKRPRISAFEKEKIIQPFNPQEFNFRKICAEEVLYSLGTNNEHSVLINNAPLCNNHILFAPYIEQCLPQVLTQKGFSSALEFFSKMSNPTFRLIFNSLGGLASVNHLHFQGLFLPHAANFLRLPVEDVFLASSAHILRPPLTAAPFVQEDDVSSHLFAKDVTLSWLKNYPAQVFAFHLPAPETTSFSPQSLMIVAEAVRMLQRDNIPHNVVIGQSPQHQPIIFLFPRDPARGIVDFPAHGPDTPVASWEFAGVFLAKTVLEFESLSGAQIATALAFASVRKDTMQRLFEALAEYTRSLHSQRTENGVCDATLF